MNDWYHELAQIVRGAWRFRWAGVATAWVVAVIGVLAVASQDDVYEATARVYVDTASQLRLLLDEQIVDSNVDDQLRFVREALLGRVQLERIAREVGLDSEASSDREKSAVVNQLLNSIQIVSGSDLSPARRGVARTDDTYLIRYQNEDRAVALAVVEKLLTIFVEDTLGAKRTSSRAASEFISKQIKEYENRLQDAEDALAQFNRENYDRLPNMQGGYFQSLQRARDELDSTRQELQLAQSRLDSIQRQLTGEAPRVPLAGQLDPNSIDARVIEAQRRLDDLRMRFTDQHPDVIAASEMLDQLRAQQKELYSSTENSESGATNPVFQALLISRNEAQSEVAALEAEVSQRQSRVQELQSLIDEMPEVEAELARLNRDYDVIRAHYQSLLNSLEREKLTREVQESEEVEFRIIDPPSADIDPVAPRRILFLIAVLAVSLGTGFGVAYVLGQVRPVLDSPQSLQAFAKVPVLGAVQAYYSEADRARQHYAVIGFTLVTVGVVMFVGGIVASEIIGFGIRV